MSSFADRVETAEAVWDLTEHHTPEIPAHLVDQLQAAAGEARGLLFAEATIEHAVTGRLGHERRGIVFTRNEWVRVMAGALACPPCLHLRRNPAQPAFVRLPHRRADCQRCVRTWRRPIVPDDQCDICDTRTKTFWPIRLQHGNQLVLGDVCRDCAQTIGIEETP